MSNPICKHCAAGVQLFKQCPNLPAGIVLQGCSCLSSVPTYLLALCCKGAAVQAVSEPTCQALCCKGVAVSAVSQPIYWHCAAGVQLLKRCRNLPAALWCRGAGCLSSVGTYLPGTVLQGCRLFKRCWNLPSRHCGAGCLNGVWTYLLGTVEQGCRLFKWCQFLPPDQVRWAELDILLNFYLRTDQVKPVHRQLLLLRSACFFLLREIYSVRMSTSECGSIILLNNESFHLISVDPIWKFEIVWCESQETKLNAVWHIFNSFASCRCFKKKYFTLGAKRD